MSKHLGSDLSQSSINWCSMVVAVVLVLLTFVVTNFLGASTVVLLGGSGVLAALTVALVQLLETQPDRTMMVSWSLLSGGVGTSLGLALLLVLAAIGPVNGSIGVHLGFLWTLLSVDPTLYVSYVVGNTIIAGGVAWVLWTVAIGTRKTRNDEKSTHESDHVGQIKASYLEGRISEEMLEEKIEQILERREDREPNHGDAQGPGEERSIDQTEDQQKY